MKKFTDIMIRSLKPKPKPYVLREDAPRGEGGFALRVMPSGSKSWQMIYSFDGQRKWLSLGSYPSIGVADAREKFRQKKSILAKGLDPGQEERAKQQVRRDAMTVDKLCDQFLEKYAYVKKRPRSAKEDEHNLARDIRPQIGNRKARDIERPDIIQIIDSILARGAHIQANRTLATIRKMFAWAVERSIVPINPAAGISKPSNERAKERALSLDEICSLWTETYDPEIIPPEGAKALKLILLTGCRPGEVLNFTWENYEDGWLEIPGSATKNKNPHRVYFSEFVKEIIGDPSEGMIVSRYDGSQVPVYSLSSWIRRSNHLGLTPWTPHDLRRTCATRLAESGVNPFIVQKILNHAPQGITAQVYNQYSYAKEISSALEALGNTVRNKLKAQVNRVV